MNYNYYDIIIIGGGLSGLYSAYQIKKISPKCKLLVLESNKRPFIGGRVGNDTFYGANIVIGAGVGRQATDKLLINLLDELHISYQPFISKMNYSNAIGNKIDINKYMQQLRDEYERISRVQPMTFKQFAKPYLGEHMYNNFLLNAGFTDYENEDIYDVLHYYQMRDNAPGWTALHIHWETLITKLCNKIGYNNIKTSSKVETVTKISSKPCLFSVITDNDVEYYSNKVIIATRITTTQKLLPQFKIYNDIVGQPFIYVYAKFNKLSAKIMHKYVPYYTIVPPPLQKIIPMDAEKGVYMIAYADNANAEVLSKKVDNNAKNRTFFEKAVEKALNINDADESLKIIAITDYYWPIGTHYYKPLNTKEYENRREFIKKAQHPERGLLVVGECVSIKQGWTEGALESVHTVLNDKWLLQANC